MIPELAGERSVQLSPLVRRITADNPSPFTFTGTQTYVIGQGEVAVIDPGPNDPAHIDAIIGAVADERIVAILCTHTHKDHSPAAKPLAERTGAPVMGCGPLVLEDLGPRADASFDDTYAPGRIMADGETLSGPGWTLGAVATPGHTSNHLCFELVEEAALFTGDHVMGWSTTVISPPDGDMADYMASLAKLESRSDAIYYPAHGDPVEKPQRFVRSLAGHRKQREGQILRLIDKGTEQITAMVPQMYAGLDERLFGAAGRSVLAHLLDLEQRGVVVRTGDDWRRAA
jgi:glyoxylase-like metal-dependent hydrolase (beta-lactamase superfamily II)